MDTFICPLIAHPNHLVVKRVNDILCKKVIPYPSDIDAEFDELANIIKNSKSGYEKPDTSYRNPSVSVTKNTGKVNSAHGSAHKSLKDKIERTRNAEESNSKSTILTLTHTWKQSLGMVKPKLLRRFYLILSVTSAVENVTLLRIAERLVPSRNLIRRRSS